jgi:hypothetical protein
MKTFTLTSPKWEGDIKLTFYDNGFLQQAEFPEVVDRKSMEYFATHFPLHISVLQHYRENSRVVITQLKSDTSFDAFWELYNQKRGSKPVAEQYWEGVKRTVTKRPITETDREDIMRILRKYVARYRGEKKEFQPLATSFLNQRMWEAELETVKRENEVNLLHLFKTNNQ